MYTKQNDGKYVYVHGTVIRKKKELKHYEQLSLCRG